MLETWLCRLRTGFARTKLCCCTACLLLYLLLVRVSGAGLWGAFLFVLCAFAYLYLPGRFWSRVMGMDAALPQYTAPIGIMLGTGFLAALYCVCMRLGLLWVLRTLPPLLGFFWLLFLRGPLKDPREAIRSACRDGASLSFAALWGALLVLFALQISVKNAHPTAAGEIILTQDMMWNIGNANSFALAFPPQDIRFSMVRFSYHYLTELVMGALAIISGVSCYDIFIFYAAPLVLAALLVCLLALGNCFYPQAPEKARLFPFCLLLFNCASLWTALTNGRGIFNNTNLMHLITNINAQGTAVIFISIFTVLFVEMARRGFAVSVRYLLVFLGSAVLMCFAKGPEAAIAVCSFVITMLFLLFRKPKFSRALPALVGVPALFVAIYFTIFSSGTNTSIHFGFRTVEDSSVGAWLAGLCGGEKLNAVCIFLGALVLAFCMQPLQLPLYFRALWRDVRRLWQLAPERLFAHGAVAGGFLAYFLFWHPSYSQLYFALLAILFLNLLAAEEFGTVRARPAKAFLTGCGAVGFATTLVLFVNFTGSGMRQLARNLDIIPKYPYVSTARAGDEEAALWLRENTPPTSIFATNRIHSMANVTDGISSLYSAMSGRQAFMEGYTYAVTNMGVSEPVVREKQEINDALFSADTPADVIDQYCESNGIAYLVFSKQYPGDTRQFAAYTVVFENEDAAIYAMRP